MDARPDERVLLLVRHAKAKPDGVDRARVLTERGEADAAELGRWIAANDYLPEAAIVSPATRAAATWRLAAAQLPVPVEVTMDHRIYDNTLDDLIGSIHSVASQITALAVVGHNPSVHGLGLVLADRDTSAGAASFPDDFPTGSVAVFGIDGPWTQVGHAPARLLGFAVCRG